MKNILVAIDFSASSMNALRIAANIANLFDADILMVNVCKPCSNDALYPVTREMHRKEARKRLEKLVEKFQNKLKGKIEYKIRNGHVYEEIVNQAKYSDSDLIIAGTHGISGLEEFFMGSNAFRIVTTSHCPTLTIREDYKGDTFSSILLPLDASRDTRQKITFSSRLAKAFGSKVHILGIYQNANQKDQHKINIYCKQAKEYLDRYGVENETHYTQSRKVADAAIEFAKKLETNLISIMSEIDSSAFSRVLGNQAQRIVNHSGSPVLCVHAKSLFNYQTTFKGV